MSFNEYCTLMVFLLVMAAVSLVANSTIPLVFYIGTILIHGFYLLLKAKR